MNLSNLKKKCAKSRRGGLLFNLALAEERLGHYERAAEVYRETLAVTPDGDPEIRARLGGVLAATGNLDAARAELEAVLAADPDCIEALVALGMTELGAGRMDGGRCRGGPAHAQPRAGDSRDRRPSWMGQRQRDGIHRGGIRSACGRGLRW